MQQNLKLLAQNAKSDTFTHFWTFQVEKRICLRYLIVDEVSMLGQNMMAWVDKRLLRAV